MIRCLDDNKNLIGFEEISSIDDNDMILIEREAKSIKISNLKEYFGSNNDFVFSFSKDDGLISNEYLSVITKKVKGLYDYINKDPSKIEVEVNGVKLLRVNSSEELNGNSFFLRNSDDGSIYIDINLLERDKDYYIQIIKDTISSEYNVALGCFREMTESELPLIIRLSYSE